MNNIEVNELALGNKLFGKKPKKSLKTNLLASLSNLSDEMSFNIKNPPLINKYSDIEVWKKGISSIQAPETYENYHFHILKNDSERITCLVWAKDEIPEETHHHWKESILLLEGTCDFRAGNTLTHYEAGTYIDVPDTEHEVIVTSDIPLKFIVQRIPVAH